MKQDRRIDRYIAHYRRKLIPGRFRCAVCKAVFDKGWSDEAAAAEASTNFPGYVPREEDLVCDPCFNKVNKHYGGGWVNEADPSKGAVARVITSKETDFLSKDMEDLMVTFKRDLIDVLGVPAEFFDHDYHAHDNEYNKAIYNSIKRPVT